MPTHRREPSRIPVRGALALALTLGGLALLLSLRTPGTAEVGLAIADTQGLELPSSQPAAARTPSGAPTAAAGASPDPSAAASAGASPAASAAATPEPSPSASPSAAPELVTLTGEAYRFRFGTVQVAVTVSGSDIVEVEALSLPDGDRHSLQISQYVEPILREEAVAADSADIDVISGATYTSRAYAASLQSALDQLGT
jgi:uncharacterized protein with FMN-binding domain